MPRPGHRGIKENDMKTTHGKCRDCGDEATLFNGFCGDCIGEGFDDTSEFVLANSPEEAMEKLPWAKRVVPEGKGFRCYEE